MATHSPRLLVTLPASSELRAAILDRLRGVPVAFTDPADVGPWPTAEALLVGNLHRELPHWRADLAPRLRFVQQLFTGLDRFPFSAFGPDVAIAGNVGAYAPFVAEHAVALVLALAHEIVPNFEKVRRGRLRPPTPNRYLIGGTALVLGFGEIGRETADRLRALGLRVEGVGRTPDPRPGADRMYGASELAAALAGADVIVECRPLTRATRGTIDAAALNAMRPAAIFVNVGRAATVDETALYEHLRDHPAFRAGTDVWWREDFEAGELGSSHAFTELPNFLGSPHVAGVGSAARARAESLALENLVRFFAGARPLHVADRADYGDGPATRPPA